jgi:DNA-binding transcriptional ArsR family regulator
MIRMQPPGRSGHSPQVTVGVSTKAKLFRGFSDPSRLSIVEALRAGPLSVGEIVSAAGLSQPNTSNHLACLLDCGLVTREQRGRFVYYELSDPRIDALLEQAQTLVTHVARGVHGCATYELEEPTRPNGAGAPEAERSST